LNHNNISENAIASYVIIKLLCIRFVLAGWLLACIGYLSKYI